MKKTLTALLILISTIGYSQKKDSVVYLPDSVNTISVSDIQKLLVVVGDRISKNEGDAWIRAFQELINMTVDKRQKIIPKKN